MPYADPEVARAYAKEYRKRRKATHAERDKEYNRQWALDNPEKRAAAQRRYLVKYPERRMVKKAVARGLPCDLTPEDLLPLPLVCPVLGITLSTDGDKDSSHSLDRIDSSLGYTRDNVRVISWRANMLKNNATLEELVLLGQYAERILNRGEKGNEGT